MATLMDRARAFGAWLLGLSFPIKLVIGAFLGILGGSGYLGLLSEFAAYWYAIGFGFRPPMEGIPYLQATVTLTSFLLLIGAAAAFAVVYGFARQVVSKIESYSFVSQSAAEIVLDKDVADPVEQVRLSAPETFLRISFGLSFTAGLLLGLLLIFTKEFGEESWRAWLAGGLFAGVLMLALCLARWPGLAWWVALTAAALLLIAGPTFFFSRDFYSRFLRETGYGGGLSVLVDVEPDTKDSARTHAGNLLLRTNQSLFLYDAGTREILEVPLQRVRAIRHPAQRLDQRAVTLPTYPR